MQYERGMYGRFGWGNRSGGGYFGGEANRFWVYGVRVIENTQVWITDPGRWESLGGGDDAEENEAITKYTVLPWGFDGVDVAPTDVVFEECPQGGTLIYSRYPTPDGYHRYLAADEKGVLSWDNKIRINSNSFSGCGAGTGTFSGDIATSGRKMGEFPAPTEADFRKVTDIVRTSGVDVEGFAAEPAVCDQTDDDGIEYCDTGDMSFDAGDMSTRGLFQIEDVTDPPQEMRLGSVRRVLIRSLSPRLEDIEYVNKRLVVVALDPTTGVTRLAMLDDVQDNRNRGSMELVNKTFNGNSAVVIGSPDAAEEGGYPHFLDTQPVSIPNARIGKVLERGEIKVIKMRKEVSKATIWINSAASLLSAWLSVATFGRSIPLSVASAAVSMGSAAAAVQQGVRSNEAARELIATAIATNMLIYNNLGSGALNPYLQRSTRFVLSLAKPGLHPEFELVPWMLNVGTVGVDLEEKRDDDTYGSKYMLRDKEEKSNTLVLIPARNVKYAGDVKERFPAIITEYTEDNFIRIGRPFYLFSIKKRMFLVPPDTKTGPPRWAVTGRKKSEQQGLVKLVLKGTSFALRIRKIQTDTRTEAKMALDALHDDVEEQLFFREMKNSDFRLLSVEQYTVVYGEAHTGEVLVRGSGPPKDDEWWTMDDMGRLTHKYSGKRIAAEYNEKTGKYRGPVTLQSSSIAHDKFEIKIDPSCTSKISYGEKDVLAGRVPDNLCIKPWYFYEMNINDPELDDSAVDMKKEPYIMRLSADVKGSGEREETSNIQHNESIPSRKMRWDRPRFDVHMTPDVNGANAIAVGRWKWDKEYHSGIRGSRKMTLQKTELRWNQKVDMSVFEKTYILGPRTKLIISYASRQLIHDNAMYDSHRVIHFDGLTHSNFHGNTYEFAGTVEIKKLESPEDVIPSP